MNQILDFFSWYDIQSDEFKTRPWLVLGKGPTLNKINDYDITSFNTFGLNHVVNEMKLNISHCIDLDVVEQCHESVLVNSEVLIMPWVPHINNRPGRLNLLQLIDKHEYLQAICDQNKLIWYNKIGSRRKVESRNGSPKVEVVYFSAEAPYALLGKAGVKVIRSLGVDGGGKYSSKFSKLNTLLNNGWQNFDNQFSQIAKSITKYKINAATLDMESPVRVFIAATEKQMLCAKVLEYSIKKHASVTVEVTMLCDSDIHIPQPIDDENKPKTPFSFQRFLIPELCNYQGKAIYLDSDMLVFSDIKMLWIENMKDSALISASSSDINIRIPQYSVMLIDCSKCQWNIKTIIKELNEKLYSYKQLLYSMCIVDKQAPDISCHWNSLENYKENVTKLLHYTDMNMQPWLTTRNRYAYLWCNYLFDAIKSGFIKRSLVIDHIDRGWVRPSLLYQIDENISDPLLLPTKLKILDILRFTPPHISDTESQYDNYFKAVFMKSYGLARKVYFDSGLKCLIKRLKK